MFCKRTQKIAALMLICFLVVTGIPIGNHKICTTNTYAATTTKNKISLFDSNKTMSKTVYADLTGDEQAEKVNFQITYGENDIIDTFHIRINGENALTLKSLGYVVKVSCLKFSAKEIFMYIVDASDNGDPTVDAIYHYNENTKKLEQVLVLDTVNYKKGTCHVYSTVKVSNGTLKVTYMGQMLATGYIKWVYEYNYKNGKFVLKNNTAKIFRKWHKGNFVANKNITFYKKAGTTKKAFTIKQGTSVKLQKIKTVKNTYYLQFKYGKKTGWIKAGKTNIFKDVVLVG